MDLAKGLKKVKKTNIKEYRRLSALILFSPMTNSDKSRFTKEEAKALFEERDALLRKYGLINSYFAVRNMLDNVHSQAIEVGLPLEFTKNYFPRFINGRKGKEGFAKKYGIQVKTFNDAIEAENKRRAISAELRPELCRYQGDCL